MDTETQGAIAQNEPVAKRKSYKTMQRKEFLPSPFKFIVFALICLFIYGFIAYEMSTYLAKLPYNDEFRYIIMGFLIITGLTLLIFIMMIYTGNIKKRIVVYPDSLEYLEGKISEKAEWRDVLVTLPKENFLNKLYSSLTIYINDKNFYIDNLFFPKFSTIAKLMGVARESSTLSTKGIDISI